MIWMHEDFSDEVITAEHLKYIVKNKTLLNVSQLILGGIENYKTSELLALMMQSFTNLKDIMVSLKKEDSLEPL